MSTLAEVIKAARAEWRGGTDGGFDRFLADAVIESDWLVGEKAEAWAEGFGTHGRWDRAAHIASGYPPVPENPYRTSANKETP